MFTILRSKFNLAHLREALFHKTMRDIVVNTLGNFMVIGFTAIYYYLMIRSLPKTDYAVISVLFGIVFVLNNMLDFGITAALYNTLPGFDKNQRHEKLSFVKTNFMFQIICSSIVVVVFFYFSPLLDQHVFKINASPRLYFWALLAVEAFLLQNFITNILMASKKVILNNVIVNVANTFKSLVLIYLLYTKTINLELMIIILGVFGPMIMGVILFVYRFADLWQIFKVPFAKKHLHLHYSITYFLSQQVFNLAVRIDLFLLSFFLVKEMVAEYAAAQKVILVVISAIISITQVLSAQFAGMKSKNELNKLLRRSFVYMLIPVAAFIGTIILPESIYIAFFQPEYTHTGMITRLLSMAYLLFILVSVLQMVFLYTFKNVKFLLVSNTIFLLVVGILCYLLIPIYGIYGPTIAYLIGFVTVAFMSIFEYRKNYQNWLQ